MTTTTTDPSALYWVDVVVVVAVVPDDPRIACAPEAELVALTLMEPSSSLPSKPAP
ncbi:MAG: hypothetical protein U1E62_22170 [Alsobacter sp.]